MKCLFKEVQESYISFNMLPYRTTEVFIYIDVSLNFVDVLLYVY